MIQVHKFEQGNTVMRQSGTMTLLKRMAACSKTAIYDTEQHIDHSFNHKSITACLHTETHIWFKKGLR